MSSRSSRAIGSSNLINLSEVQPIIIAHNQRNNCKGGDKNYKNIEIYFINTIARSHVHSYFQIKIEIILRLFYRQVHLENIALHLIEDRPSSNITSPGSLPIDLAIPFLTITRDKTGLFSIQPTGMFLTGRNKSSLKTRK